MAYTLRIARAVAEIKKQGHLNEDVFYRLLSEQCNYIAPEMVKTFYLALVRHVTSELRTRGVVRLPMLGDFYLLKQENTKGWNGKHLTAIEGKYLLKFDPNETWKKYWTKAADGGALLDPREKLNMMPKESEGRPSSLIIDPMDNLE